MQDAEQKKPPFFFDDKILAARFQMLKNLVGGNDCLNFVIGEKGSGKTTLLDKLLTSMTGHWRTCNMKIESGSGRQNVAAVGNLNGRAGILLNSGSPPVLLFDDAHEINIKGLCYLVRHSLGARNKRKFRGIVLFCDPPSDEFIKTLSESVPSQSVVNTLHINPLTFEQTEQFLHQLSRYLEPTKPPIFSPSQAKKIFEASMGLPGRIHDEAKRMATTGSNRKGSLLKKLVARFT
jgi:type II secretory pathway predicted ATPase ExeA